MKIQTDQRQYDITMLELTKPLVLGDTDGWWLEESGIKGDFSIQAQLLRFEYVFIPHNDCDSVGFNFSSLEGNDENPEFLGSDLKWLLKTGILRGVPFTDVDPEEYRGNDYGDDE